MPSAIQLEAMAEDALLLRFGDTIDASFNERVHAAARRIHKRWPTVECVPAYASLLLRFDIDQWSGDDKRTPHHRLGEAVSNLLANPSRDDLLCDDVRRNVLLREKLPGNDVPPSDPSNESVNARLVDIPVHYGEASAPDLAEVAELTGLSVEEVTRRHCAVEYRVAMLGFAPGFAYLLGLDSTLAVPRRADPRQRVPAGSVAIGGSQTGIYPDELPGGWRLIGRTPRQLFDATADAPSLLLPGDRVRFHAIDEAEFRQLAAAEKRCV